MVGQGNGKTFSAFSSLRRFAQEQSEKAVEAVAQKQAVPESCELCSEPIPPEHRHLLNVSTREIMCACRPCSILFDKEAASEGKLRLVPDRCLSIEDFEMSDVQWASLRIPVDMAFFFHSTPVERVAAFYPSPMGPTESLLELSAWEELEEGNPVLKEMERDAEALLINRVRGTREYFLVPIDECYSLVGLIRIHWRGLSGGQEVWEEIDRFFEALRRRSKKVGRKG
ncbi:MAG: Uncharacterized protein MSMEG_2717 [uncultured Rubrobacteraceae bacterium]|uniref:Uncharacterized protein MSMEG_2717 n=1 Tax=uncultured Rubrobacteraceae bacterium TaxID=349277 RepID=A0A6J4NWH1_9ACTN|nr:MAG: Uncharacterized protein MSMEG_2717 [uncultured Rubrobacteraceae bacterium]